MKLEFLTILLALFVVHLSSIASADTLSTDQREKLSKTLKSLIEKNNKILKSRQSIAYNAYKNAMASTTSAYDFYIECTEKVNFIDAGKKSSDFRDWKKAQKEKISDAGFRTALRHQLNWLVLTIEATANEDEDYTALGSKARSAINSIFNDAKAIGSHHSLLKRSVLGSVFAKAYGFDSFKVENWPTAPLNFNQVYEAIIFPPLRSASQASLLRSAWKECINYKEKSILEWTPVPKSKTIGMKKNNRPPAHIKFLAVERPNLIWQMERDVFDAGAEFSAASNMLNHIMRNQKHNNATKWATELDMLLNPVATVDSEFISEGAPETKPTSAPAATIIPSVDKALEAKKSNSGYLEIPLN